MVVPGFRVLHPGYMVIPGFRTLHPGYILMSTCLAFGLAAIRQAAGLKAFILTPVSYIAHEPSLYESLAALPEGLTGEIINGQIHTQPRPAWPHALASSRLGSDIEGPYGRGRGGPGGWWIIFQPEIHFTLDIEVTVSDLAGWRRERMPIPPDSHKIQVVPDWVCEIFSPATKSKDREVKMPLYARYGVQFAWLVDPKLHRLEAFKLHDGSWNALGTFRDNDRVSVEPFDAITIVLSDLWASV
jgi:Uma2 family endonuclease